MKYISQYGFIDDMKRREYLAVSASGSIGLISGCSSLGGPTYTSNAEEYLLPFAELNRILPSNASARKAEYSEDSQINSGMSYRFQRGSLAEFGVLVAKSLNDAEEAFDNLIREVDTTGTTQGQQVDLGDEAVFDEVAGSRILGIRLDNLLIQMNGRTSARIMERLSVAQIDRIEQIG